MENTEVTEVEFVPIKPRAGLIGFASCVIDSKFYVGGIGVHTMLNGEGYRITYPTRKIGKVDFPLCHPIREEVGAAIQKAITEKVKDLVESVT